MNESNATGVFDQVKGKIKQAFGEATDNQSLANEGAADQVKGHAEEAWGNVKDTAHDVSHSRTAEETRARIYRHLSFAPRRHHQRRRACERKHQPRLGQSQAQDERLSCHS